MYSRGKFTVWNCLQSKSKIYGADTPICSSYRVRSTNKDWAIPDIFYPPSIEGVSATYAKSGIPLAILLNFPEIQSEKQKRVDFEHLCDFFGKNLCENKDFYFKKAGNPGLYFTKKVWKSNLLYVMRGQFFS